MHQTHLPDHAAGSDRFSCNLKTVKGYVGIYTARLEMPWVTNLKEKRALVRPVTEKLKARFPVSVARLDGLNTHGWELIGATTISNDAGWVEQTLHQVAEFVASQGEYSVQDEQFEVLEID